MNPSIFLRGADYDSLVHLVGRILRLWVDEPADVRRYDLESAVILIGAHRDLDGQRIRLADPDGLLDALVAYSPLEEGVVDPGDVAFILAQYGDIYPARIRAFAEA